MFKVILLSAVLAMFSLTSGTAFASGSQSTATVNDRSEAARPVVRPVVRPSVRRVVHRVVEPTAQQRIKVDQGVYIESCSAPVSINRRSISPNYRSNMPVLAPSNDGSKMKQAAVKTHCARRLAPRS